MARVTARCAIPHGCRAGACCAATVWHSAHHILTRCLCRTPVQEFQKHPVSYGPDVEADRMLLIKVRSRAEGEKGGKVHYHQSINKETAKALGRPTLKGERLPCVSHYHAICPPHGSKGPSADTVPSFWAIAFTCLCLTLCMTVFAAGACCMKR